MEDKKLLERIHQLESEISDIKKKLEPPKKKKWYHLPVAFFTFLKSWGLISTLSALVIATFVKFTYNIDFFEEYENNSKYKEISNHYLELGEKLMENLEWEAAEEAFQQSLKIKENNMEASTRLAMVQVFTPEKGQEYFDYNVASIKLNQLEKENNDDYMFHFLKGNLYETGEESEKAYKSYLKCNELCAKAEKKFLGGNIQIGNIYMKKNLDTALSYYKKAYDVDSTNAIVLCNYGACNFIKGNFEDALPHLKKAYYSSPDYSRALTLGEAYRFKKDFASAILYDKWAWDILNEKDGKSMMVREGAFWNCMPQKEGDSSAFKETISTITKEDKIIFAGYLLSFDYALSGNISEADKYFQSSFEKDKGYYAYFIQSRIGSIFYFIKPEGNIEKWFLEKYVKLK